MEHFEKLRKDIWQLDWKFPPDSKLTNYNEFTPCREIFMAICDEIGKFFTHYGFKYSRSKPKLEIKQGDLTLKVNFFSSGSNMPGSYVNLEINPDVYSNKLAQQDKDEEYDAKGFLLGSIDFTYKTQPEKPDGTVTVELLDGTIADERVEDFKGARYIKNRNYNVYGLTEEKFIKVIQYIFAIAIEPFVNLTDRNYLIQFINEAAYDRFGRDTERLKKYVHLTFPQPQDILQAIDNKINFFRQP